MAINPNSAFVRVVFDLATPVAIKLSEHLKAKGQSRNRYLSDLVARDLDATPSKPAKTKGK